MENKHNICIDEYEVVCRLCIKIPLNGSYIALGESGNEHSFIRNMIQIHLPKMDLSISKKPIICEVCHVQLQNYVSFATNCIAVEEKIKLYCDRQKVNGPVNLARVLQFMEDEALDLHNKPNKDLVMKQEDDFLMVKLEKVQDAEDYILEDHLVDSSSASELYLKNEIEIKSENEEMSEEMEESVPTVALNNSGESGSLKTKRQIRKYPSKGTAKSEVKMHKCENCEYETNNISHLRRHNLRHKDKSEVEMHKCENCEYETSNMSHLRRHYLRKHKDESEVEMLKCVNCEYETKNKNSMKLHMMKHLDPNAERKFKCDKCPYETDVKWYLCKHNLKHKDKSEVEMYKCANCEFESKRKYSLMQHVLTHRDRKAQRKFKCDECSYETNRKDHLRKHNMIHKEKSEVEMHKCEHCEYETRFKCNMILHVQRKHQDPKT